MLRRAPKKGLTARQIAVRAALAESTVAGLISNLHTVSVIGTLQTGQRGRPAKLYTLAA